MTKVSVILPVYNAAPFLKEAIDSIVNQIYTDWELIIINDGSTDSSEEIILDYTDTRFRYYKNDANIGLIATLNKAIALSSGEYIARMDADDISLPDRFTKQVQFLDRNREYAICGTFARIIDIKGNVTGKIVHVTDNDYLKINLLFSVPFIHPDIMIRKNMLDEDRIFDKEYLHAEDYDLWARIARKHKIANIPQFLFKYRWHGSNVSITNSEKQETVKDEIIKRELNILGLNPDEEEFLLHKVSFAQFDSKNSKERKTFDNFDGLDTWFSKIIGANDIKKQYKKERLIEFLWSRWIIVCIVQKRYRKILKPKFVPFNMKIWMRTAKLLAFLSKKK